MGVKPQFNCFEYMCVSCNFLRNQKQNDSLIVDPIYDYNRNRSSEVSIKCAGLCVVVHSLAIRKMMNQPVDEINTGRMEKDSWDPCVFPIPVSRIFTVCSFFP